MNKKQFYSAPEAELLVLKIEENFCGTNIPGGAGPDDTTLDDEEIY